MIDIDKYELVKRHSPVLRAVDIYSPFTVGNGEFAFTADITGLQSFSEAYESGIPLCTMSQWGWHSYPSTGLYNTQELKLKYFNTYGKKVGYPVSSQGQEPLFNWLRQNPHKFHLGKIGLKILLSNGKMAELNDIKNINQVLDLWQGVLVSSFSVEGFPVTVKTCCHPVNDILAVSVESQLFLENRLYITFRFPYGHHEMNAADWSCPDRHSTVVVKMMRDSISWLRQMDNDRYFTSVNFSRNVAMEREDHHSFSFITRDNSKALEFVCSFSREYPRECLPSYESIIVDCKEHWDRFWCSGGALELSNSKDARAYELERRIVLSQYLTAVQCAGSMPPQETGLTCNSWFGKAHLEMHWWHAAHFPMWGRADLLEKSMWWYGSILGKAEKLAEEQGYKGVRWPKMVGPEGLDSPSVIGPLLIWQQPHPIYYAELCYRNQPEAETLKLYKDIVFKTADFMASFIKYDNSKDRFVLGPPVIPAQENHLPEETLNPVFEIEYWVFGLKTAQLWRKRLEMKPLLKWEQIIAKMSELPEKDGVYLAHEKCPDTFGRKNYDHPSMLGALGVLPGICADREVMLNTLKKVIKEWKWDSAWGWDFPMAAMTAARLGEPDLAVDILMMDNTKNTYLNNGHNFQSNKLPVYLPGNGGLLIAAAMMAAGWENGPGKHAPGFPSDGAWEVAFEGIKPLL